eukprot:TRINITY_DN27033_c0_g1_i1.p1 TRINITY_DN27033_c0_g1~~TRINITY_DN27033_c0_g1_i1.p1  ORF type:complete len:566 (-),score=76.24 TRINITY_DN27033_c0_g1_i1:375-2072(-)
MSSRLPQLLRYFKLPPNANAAELRQVYLKRVKEVHPDAGGRSSKDFLDLQQNFREACELLAAADAPRTEAQAPQSWPKANAGVNAHPRTATTSHGAASQAVPVTGLPQGSVYPLAGGMLLAAGAAFFLSHHARSSTEVTEHSGRSSPSSPKTETNMSRTTAEHPKGSEASAGSKKTKYAPIQSGPWNVSVAKAATPRKGIWSPSSTHEFLDSDSFYASRAKGHSRAGISQRVRLGEKQGGQIKGLGYEANYEPQIRRDIEMLPIHMAAEDGNLWALEQCGANTKCRSLLNVGDAHGDTPLHHGAWAGRADSCLALLRLGAETDADNNEGVTPEEIAKNRGHNEVAELIRSARQSAYGEGAGPSPRHPDGLGVMAEPPEGVIFVGLQASEILRHSMNMAAGVMVAPPLPISKNMRESDNAAVKIAGVVRGCIQDTEFDLQDPLPLKGEGSQSATDFWKRPLGQDSNSDIEACGLLIYEPPKAVSPDAPGHWVAIRQESSQSFWRLDPVRGPFRLSASELEELVQRYQAWRVVRGSLELRQQRSSKVQAASQEAEALLSARDRVRRA